MEDNFDVDKFASLIKTKTSIWNYRSEEYLNKTHRTNDWNAVCEGMIPDFAEKTDEEQSVIVNQLQTKWRVLRDGFTRSVKNYAEKLETGNKGRLYIYYEQLRFLQDLYDKENEPIYTRNKKEKCRKRHRRNDDEEEFDADIMHHKRTCSKARAGCNSSEYDNEPGVEEDKQFLLSLLSDFRKIPEDQKLDAKGDIINVIRHYRSTTIQLEARGTYYTTNDVALAATTADDYYEQALIAEGSRESSPPRSEIKYIN